MEIFIILGLILFNGLFAMAEIALISARKTKLEVQANKGDEQARYALALANHPEKFLSTVQIGITISSIVTGIFSEGRAKESVSEFINKWPVFHPHSNAIATIVVVMIITYLSLVSELWGKRIGLSKPEKIAKLASQPMRLLSLVAYPFIWLLSHSTSFLTKLFNIKPNDSPVTEEEIKAIINEGTETGAIEEKEQEMIERIFHLGDRKIMSLMTHRSDIVWMNVNSKVADIKQKMSEVVHTNYPLCEGAIDNIKGIVSIKDILLANDDMLLADLMKPGLYVPENNSVHQVLEKFKKQKANSCFIVDEYGSLQGMMTLNDILEAIVGEIGPTDEEDYEIVERQDGTYLIDGQFPFYDFLARFERIDYIDNDEPNFNTLAGFILHHLKTIPATGDKFEWQGFKFEIIDMDGNRIDKVLLTMPQEEG